MTRLQDRDRLFASGDDWWHNACLNFATDDWELYCCGYRDAADLLVDRVVSTQSSQDVLVYPIVFLYRQYLELRLKILIRDAVLLLDREASIPAGHKIESLWAHARSLLIELEPERALELPPVDEGVAQFAALDPSSTTFRYPVDLKGRNPLAGLRYLSIVNFRERFNVAAALLEGAATMLAEYLDARADMLGDLR